MIDDRDLLRHLETGGDELYERVEPPALDLDAITGASSATGPRAARTWSLRPRVALGGAAACLASGLACGALLFGGTTAVPQGPVVASTATTPSSPPRTRQVTLARFNAAAPVKATAQVNVFTATDGRTVDLRVEGMPPTRKGQFYELWVLGDAGKMISLGVVRVNADGTARARMPLPVSLRRFPVFDLSLEPGDGNPQHSGNSMLRSAAVI